MDIGKYFKVVNSIVDGYFDNDGEYAPHVGRLQTMWVYYNNYYPAGIEHPIDDLDEMLNVVDDPAFIESFTNAKLSEYAKMEKDTSTSEVIHRIAQAPFSFHDALDDAMEIVYHRKSSLYAVEAMINRIVKTATTQMENVMSQKNFDQLMMMAADIKNGKLNADALVEAVHNSPFFKEKILGGLKQEATDNVTNVDFSKK